ncbi:MAG TPA: SRPBCC domain-containing protein [Ktedonobacterales bacterium]|nr:SRPBCC domain-containing protein [Ktedonobacterales bacterium]
MAAIVKELTIEAAPQRVWAALTQPNEIGHWWTNDLNATPEVGSLAEFRFGEWGDFVVRFEIAELEPDKTVRWLSRFGPAPHWKGTSVTWSLAPVQHGTQVVFTHDGFAQADERYAMTSAWWEHFLVSLKSYLETGKGFPGSPLSVEGAELRKLS